MSRVISGRRKRRHPRDMPSDTQLSNNVLQSQTSHDSGATDGDQPTSQQEPTSSKDTTTHAHHHSKKRRVSKSHKDSEPRSQVHRFVVHVADTDYFRTESTDSPFFCSSPTLSTEAVSKYNRKELRFFYKFKKEPPRNDKFSEGIPRRRRRRKVSTGDLGSDKILSQLELQGYAILELVNRGTFANIISAYSQVQQKVVAFKLIKDKRNQSAIEGTMQGGNQHLGASGKDYNDSTEILFHLRLSHPNIVQMIDNFVMAGQVCMVLECLDCGDLTHLLEQWDGRLLNEATSQLYFRDMVSAVQYLHDSYIVHRDIKCEHFLIDRFNHLKLCDFSHAEVHHPGDPLLTERCGSPGYQAPEVLMELPHYSPRPVDIWALGVVLYTMTMGHLPFPKDSTDQEFLTAMTSYKFLDNSDSSIRVSSSLLFLLRGILQHNVAERYSLNWIRFSEWCNKDQTTKPRMGNFYMM